MNKQDARRGFWRYLPANIATCSSLSVAMISVTLSFNHHFVTAAWCILYCVLLDKLDGLLARLCHAQSNFGMELDSFVDFAAFGLAPAALCWNFIMHQNLSAAWSHPISYVVIVYAITTVLRLVRFNVTQEVLPGNMFLGVPSTVCGGTIAAIFLVLSSSTSISHSATVFTLTITLLIAGVLMLSNLKMMKVGGSKHKWLNALILINVIAAYVCIIMNIHPTYIVFLSMVYVLVGLVYTITNYKSSS